MRFRVDVEQGILALVMSSTSRPVVLTKISTYFPEKSSGILKSVTGPLYIFLNSPLTIIVNGDNCINTFALKYNENKHYYYL